jgi:hypothetical protein
VEEFNERESMKVIGVVGRDDYLVQMSWKELENLSDNKFGEYQANPVRCGNTYGINAAWDVLRRLDAGRDDLPKIANKLRALADLLEPIKMELPAEGVAEK